MQPEIDREISMLTRHWKVDDVPAGLADRIVAAATRLPQHQPWHARLTEFLRPLMTRPQRALVPGMAFAALLLVGIYGGQMQSSDDEFGIDALLVADMADAGELDL
jgi:hypothetical protein